MERFGIAFGMGIMIERRMSLHIQLEINVYQK
jgi:hypothetical protein